MAMRRRRRISGLLTIVLVASGLAMALVTGQGPAVAAEGSLVCTVGPGGSGQPLDNCTVTDPDGIRTVRIRNTETDQQQASFSFGCANPTTSFTFKVPAGTRYKVVVTDCSVPRATTHYVLRPNGTVVRPVPPPTSTIPGTTTSTSTSTPSTAPTSTTTTTTTLPPQPVTTPNIFLGYADTEHEVFPMPPLPDPWLGDPGVTFLGCTSPSECGEWDGGAIRIDNPLSNPTLKLVDAYVDIETCHFTPWVALMDGATVGPGGMLILTQTGLLGPPQPAPCNATMDPSTWDFENFDTSEGPFDTLEPRFFNCDPNLVDPPVITLVFEGGMVLTVTDAAKVLNTGGFDRFACLGLSEATPWTGVDPANIARQN